MADNFRSLKNFTPISAINKDRMDWKIQVRICRKWKTTGNGKISETLEFLFADIQGTRIHAIVKNVLIPKFQDLCSEGDIVTVHQFSVVDRPKNFPVADFAYRIVFHRNTYVGSNMNNKFPKSVFQFKDYLDILGGSQKDDGGLFDVIGTIADINDSRLKSDTSVKGIRSIQFLLQDHEGLKIECVLWEPYCHELKEFVEELRTNKDNQVVVIQLCRARKFRGAIGVSNTFHATKVIVDQNLEEIVEYKSRLPNNSVTSSFDGSQISSASFVSVKDELQNPSTVYLTLHDLKKCEVVLKAWVVASVAEVLYEKAWFYTSCMKCKKKVVDKENKLYCGSCDDFVLGCQRYKIHINVVDGSGNAEFLLWNEISTLLIGKTASEVLGGMTKDFLNKNVEGGINDVAKVDLPEPVDKLIGKEFMFKVSVGLKHIEGSDPVYVVEKFSDDMEMIMKHKKFNHGVLPFGWCPLDDVVAESVTPKGKEVVNSDEGFKTPETKKITKRNLQCALQDSAGSVTSKIIKTEK